MKTANSFLNTLTEVLSQNKKYVSKDGALLKTKIYNDCMAMQKDLLALLLSSKELKKHFFTDIDGTLVFDKIEFSWVLESKEFLPDSFTQYKNKIGLVKPDGRLISQSNDVSLVWPYKDCILEGGQSKDEQKLNEVFYNEILAPDEVNQLLYPKVFTNPIRYTANGSETITSFDKNDNLIIKGNNLLALSSLLKQYEGKVKCIYIDPPYNTGNDSFKYNDKFNHSSWLTFIKNRLEIAEKLLSNEGMIFVSLDDKEVFFCKILMDEIFNNKNFLNDIIWHSTKSVTNTALISVSHTHTLVYFKNKNYYVKNRNKFRLQEDGKGFKNPDNDSRGPWKADPFQVGGWRPNQQYEIKNPNTGIIYTPNEGCSWKNDYEHFLTLYSNNRIIFGLDGKSGPQRKRFLSEAETRGKVSTTIWEDVGTTTNGTQHLKKLFKKFQFSNPKPEKLIEKILNLSTQPGDIVLDFFNGSGTTSAVAHKMRRQYIGIEQMDYINTVTIPRLKKVLEGEQGGISKSVDWQGGGSFVYFELKELNEQYIRQIEKATTSKELEHMKKEILNTGFISHKVDIREINKENPDYSDLSLEDKKSFLLEILDKNKLYVNYCDIDDVDMHVTEDEKAFTNSFYGKE